MRLKLVSAPGETDDQLFVWLPEEKVLCCGDNYYGCWPNLYAIRGSQYRDIAAWVDSLSLILSYRPKILFPGHTLPIYGEEEIQTTLGNFRDAIQSILLQTLDCMNQGMDMLEAVEQVKLPEKYRDLPYLQEFYGTVSWTVKGIYAGYVGWFDGNPVHLDPSPRESTARKSSLSSAMRTPSAPASGNSTPRAAIRWAWSCANCWKKPATPITS